MTITGSWSRWFAVGIVASTIAVGVPPYVTQQPTTSIDAPLEPKRPNTGLIALNFGVDWASAYYFRGIAQEQSGANFQPYGSLSFKLIENAGPPHRADRDARHLEQLARGRRHPRRPR